jgi:hypothetical protein
MAKEHHSQEPDMPRPSRHLSIRNAAFGAAAAVVLSGFPFVVLGTNIYKCTSEDGKQTFSDSPCPGATRELYYEETEQDRQRREETQHQRALAAEQAARNAALERASHHVFALIAAGRIADAHAYASQNGLESRFDELLATYQQSQIARQQQQLEQQNRALMDQRAELAAQRAELAAQEAEMAAQDARLRRARNAASHPQYVPSVGKWCQQVGGATHCW